jgi:hypothetical protein
MVKEAWSVKDRKEDKVAKRCSLLEDRVQGLVFPSGDWVSDF